MKGIVERKTVKERTERCSSTGQKGHWEVGGVNATTGSWGHGQAFR